MYAATACNKKNKKNMIGRLTFQFQLPRQQEMQREYE